jgi:hypothetical protein
MPRRKSGRVTPECGVADATKDADEIEVPPEMIEAAMARLSAYEVAMREILLAALRVKRATETV